MQDFKTERFNHYPAFGWSRGFCFSWNVRGCKIVVNRVLRSTCKADNCKKSSLVWFAVKVNYIQLISVLQMMSFLQRKVTASVVSASLPIVLCTAFSFRNKKRQTRHCLTVTVLILFPFVSGSVLLGLVRGEKCCIYELCLKHNSAVLKYIKSPRKYLNIKMQEVIDKDPSIFLLK